MRVTRIYRVNDGAAGALDIDALSSLFGNVFDVQSSAASTKHTDMTVNPPRVMPFNDIRFHLTPRRITL